MSRTVIYFIFVKKRKKKTGGNNLTEIVRVASLQTFLEPAKRFIRGFCGKLLCANNIKENEPLIVYAKYIRPRAKRFTLFPRLFGKSDIHKLSGIVETFCGGDLNRNLNRDLYFRWDKRDNKLLDRRSKMVQPIFLL